MSLKDILDKFKVQKAEKASPMFYDTPDGKKLGVFAFEDGIKTILPLNPSEEFSNPDGEEVSEWRLMLVLANEGKAIGDCEYTDGINRLDKYVTKKTKTHITVRALNPGELYTVVTRKSN